MGAHITKTTTNTSPMILRPNMAAQTLGVSIATFWRIVARGELQTIKISQRATGVRSSEIEAYLSARQTTAQ
ncbi:helix-turn-helix transcriptional regulator [Methylomicrobium lacus]|uniref:helix-turn-helix transcriptional regulator n=1 Tax=Methylomicrobium lacus TaxID=136992 RepID=UPI0035A899CD